jgi:hypothetical protein
MKCVSLIFLVAACGSSSSKTPDAHMIDAPNHGADGAVDARVDGAPDAPPDAPPDASGMHHHYILDSLTWPASNGDATTDGFDLDGDGSIDNQLGRVTATMASQGFDLQTPQDQAIARGAVLMLADLQADDLTTAAGAGYTMYVGTNPSPAPCTGSSDTVCGHHLTGAATFDAAATPRDAQLIGSITSNQLTAGPGHLSMQLSIVTGTPVTITLLAAHAKLTTMPFLHGTLGGAIPMSDFHMKIYPAMQTSFAATIAADCTGQNPPECGCTASSTGATLIQLFDANQDCTVSEPEIENNSLIHSLFASDVTVEGQAALSVGFAVTGVGANFTP